MMSEGLIDAGEAKREVEECKYPEGKITSENLLTQSGVFENTYNKQPQERWGLPGDKFDAFTKKLPSTPFTSILETINTFDLMNNGEVLGNYDRANKMLRQLYGKHVGLHGYAYVEKEAADEEPGRQFGVAMIAGRKMEVTKDTICFRCWRPGLHVSWECDKPGKVCEERR